MKHIHLALMAVAALGAAAVAAQPPARSFDLLITNARIIDGTGGPSITGSVAVRDGRIAGAGGKVLAPGFIDPHSHLVQRDFDSASRAFDAARNRTHDKDEKDEQKLLSAAIGDSATINVR